MNRDRIRAAVSETLNKTFWLNDHQMHIKRHSRHSFDRRRHQGTHRNVRHKSPIHHVDMDPIGARFLRFYDLLAKPREIRRQNRRRNFELSLACHIFPCRETSIWPLPTRAVFSWPQPASMSSPRRTRTLLPIA